MDKKMIHSSSLWIDRKDPNGTVFWFEIYKSPETNNTTKAFRYSITLFKKPHENFGEIDIDTDDILYWSEYLEQNIQKVELKETFHHEKKARGFLNARLSSMIANKRREMVKLIEKDLFLEKINGLKNFVNKYFEE